MKRLIRICLWMAFVLCVSLALSVVLPGRPALAVTRVVNSVNDSGAGSLRQAILNASPGDTIVFSPTPFNTALTITLSSEIEISKSLRIDGAVGGVFTPTLSGNNTNRIFLIDPGVNVALNRLKFVNGNDGDCEICNGGAIHNEGTLSVTNSLFVSNTSDFSNGGALFNGGILTLTGGSFLNNTVAWGGGGAVANVGQATILSTTFSNNGAENADGGAIHNEYSSTLTLLNITLTGNRSLDKGGGLYNDGTASIISSTFSANHTTFGGAIQNWDDGTLLITGSIFLSNTAHSGGGIYNQVGTLRLISSTLTGNQASGEGFDLGDSYGGGGIYSDGAVYVTSSRFASNCTAYGAGGGIANINIIHIEGSTFVDNSARSGMGGGLESDSASGVTNTLFLSNSASFGGGINAYGNLQVINNTLVGNTADGASLVNASCAGAAPQPVNNGTDYGGGISANTATLINTLLSRNPTGGNCATVSSSIIDGGHNLDDANTCNFTNTGSLTNANPLLGPYKVNLPGLAVSTFGFPYNSPAVDGGDPSVCPSTDMRGIRRPIGARCDIGAYEAFSKVVFVPLLRR